MRCISFVVMISAAMSTSFCQADMVPVTGGRSDASLDAAALLSVNLTITGYSAEVQDLGGGLIGFNINGRDHADRPTTFKYTVADLLPVTGTVEHTGSVFLNSTNPIFGLGSKVMGDFSIGYDMSRASTTTTGFYVESKVVATGAVTGIVFDFAGDGMPLVIAGVAAFPPDETKIQVLAPLAVSPELSMMLSGTNSLAGEFVGTYVVNGIGIPEPSSLLVLGAIGVGISSRRRRVAIA